MYQGKYYQIVYPDPEFVSKTLSKQLFWVNNYEWSRLLANESLLAV